MDLRGLIYSEERTKQIERNKRFGEEVKKGALRIRATNWKDPLRIQGD